MREVWAWVRVRILVLCSAESVSGMGMMIRQDGGEQGEQGNGESRRDGRCVGGSLKGVWGMGGTDVFGDEGRD
jgi:hypothetical protein